MAGPLGISSNGTNVWVANNGSTTVSKISILTGTIIQTITVGTAPYNISIDGTYVWVTNNFSYSVSKIDITSNKVIQTIPVGTSPRGISSDGINVWVANNGTNTVSKINIESNTVVQTITVGTNPRGISIYGPYVWVTNTGSNNVSKINATLPCFLSNSKILTSNGYVPIQDLKKGDLVKTLNHGYKVIDIIGKRKITHRARKDRIKEQLYECKKEFYPELTENLIITGCHSILVDWLTQEQGENIMKDYGDIYVTDGKPRLPSYLDERACVYEEPGNYTIYHFALEHDSPYKNYGVYANGLLVETCSKRYLTEYSDMELLSTF